MKKITKKCNDGVKKFLTILDYIDSIGVSYYLQIEYGDINNDFWADERYTNLPSIETSLIIREKMTKFNVYINRFYIAFKTYDLQCIQMYGNFRLVSISNGNRIRTLND